MSESRFKVKAKEIMDAWSGIPGHPMNRLLSHLEARYAHALEEAYADGLRRAADIIGITFEDTVKLLRKEMRREVGVER